MNEVNQLRNLMESIQLNEYLVRPGEPISAVAQLNVFTDMEEGQRPSDFEREFAEDPTWQAIEAKYIPIANKLESMLELSDNVLSDNAVNAVHNLWYDGSDSYSDVETAIEDLPGLYDKQIELAKQLLSGLDADAEEYDESINEEGGDWGSSDWYGVIRNMDHYIDQAGLSPDSILQAAKNEAESYYQDIGFEHPEDAVASIKDAWVRMSKRGQQLQKMFAPRD